MCIRIWINCHIWFCFQQKPLPETDIVWSDAIPASFGALEMVSDKPRFVKSIVLYKVIEIFQPSNLRLHFSLGHSDRKK